MTIEQRIEWSRLRGLAALGRVVAAGNIGLNRPQREVFMRYFPPPYSSRHREVFDIVGEAGPILRRARFVYVTEETLRDDDPDRQQHRYNLRCNEIAQVFVDIPGFQMVLRPEPARYVALYPRWARRPALAPTYMIHEVFHLVDLCYFRGHAGFYDAQRFEVFVAEMAGLPRSRDRARQVRRRARSGSPNWCEEPPPPPYPQQVNPRASRPF